MMMMMYENPTNFQCNYLHYSIITSYPYDCGEIASERPCWFPIFPVNSCQTNPPCSNDSHHCHYFSTGTSINFIYHHGFLVYNLRIDKGDTYLFSTHICITYTHFPLGLQKDDVAKKNPMACHLFFPQKQLAISSHPQSLWHATITLLLAIYLSVCPSVRPSIHPSICICIYQSIHQSIQLCI
jgi:hypothetical protein